MQGGIQGTLIHLQDIAGHLADAPGDGPTVRGLESESLEDQQVHGSLHQVSRLGHDDFLWNVLLMVPSPQ